MSADKRAASGARRDAQRSVILTEAQRRGWRLVNVIEDAGYTGKSLRRPSIAAAVDALAHHRGDTLVVAKPDRVGRLMVDVAGLMGRASRQHWGLVALDVNANATTPSSETNANALAVFAQFERRLIALRTKEALAAKKAQGVRLGRPRAMSDGVLRRIVTERAAGRSLTAIADGLTADAVPAVQGGKRWYASTVRKALGTAARDSMAMAARTAVGAERHDTFTEGS